MKHKSLIAGVAALLAGTAAIAQQAPNAPQRQHTQVDANADGSISRAEAQAAAEARWTRIDANRDGRLDQADRDQVRTQRRSAMFGSLDTDGNGSVTRAEWDQASDARAEREAPGEDRGGQMGRRGRGHGAGPGGGGGMTARLDTNRDNIITREEFMAAAIARHAAMDGNSDGTVTAAEREARRAERRERNGDRAGRRGE